MDPANARRMDTLPQHRIVLSQEREVKAKSVLGRPIQLTVVVFALTLTFALAALALFTWLDFKRVESIRSHVTRTELLQQSAALLKEAQSLAAGSPEAFKAKLPPIWDTLSQIPIRGAPVKQTTRERLAQLDALLTQAQTDPLRALTAAGSIIDQMLDRETAIQSDLLDAVYVHTRLEWRIALIALVAFPCMLAIALWAWRQRIFRPINNLRYFIARLSNGDFTPVTVAGIDPLLVPLFDNYNLMVTRLEQLEHANRTRTLLLEKEVRAATEALLKQQQSLARAERLAATGELSAILAHELRNPIAGIQITMANLRRDIADSSLTERIDLVTTELQRITRLLNGLLQQSSHVPEPSRVVAVDRLVQELATLMRYQLPPRIELIVRAVPELNCRLPEDGLRQAVLNLVLNSVEAMQQTPGTVTIEATRETDTLLLRVIDQGPGFPEEVLNGIRPFVTSRESGTGLGLAIVKRFAKDLGGELKLENRMPHGACVTLTMPCLQR
jgi:two-component system, NtrC family, sensor kinase